MTLEHYPASVVAPIMQAGTALEAQAYYRSKLFIAPFSTNVLVAAAGPLLSLLERLCLSTSLPPIEQIRDNIEHELRAFYSKLTASSYALDVAGIAYYLLAATIDEILGKSYLRVYAVSAEFTSFIPPTTDDVEPQKRFFDLLLYVQERPNQYLDLIELIYFCLIAGFEGDYHFKADGRQTLDNHIEHLYQIIQQYRFNKPHRLFTENPLPKTTQNSYKTAILATVLAVSLVTVAFIGSHILLENKAKTVLFGHTQLALVGD